MNVALTTSVSLAMNRGASVPEPGVSQLCAALDAVSEAASNGTALPAGLELPEDETLAPVTEAVRALLGVLPAVSGWAAGGRFVRIGDDREEVAMQPGTGRILTTHSGSLPRPSRFLSLVLAREAGEPVDEAQFTDEVRAAVRETVRLQADAGVDVLNDGEMSKPSYATYVKDRLTGFGGEGAIEQVAASVMALEEFPDFAEKMAQTMASTATIRFTSCDGPVAYVGQVFQDIKLPDGKYVIPGVLDSTTNVVEHPEVVANRLIRYAEVVGRDNVMAGTDCGFGTIAGMDTVVPTVTWAKFRAQAEGAKIASEHLWGAAA